MDPMKSITADDLANARDEFKTSRANMVAKHAVTAQGIRAVARVSEAVAANTMTFDIEVKQGERCNQERSGRCWMFASLNTFRSRIIKRYNLKTFELSQAYPLFFDKLEKANWFLENVLDTLDEDVSGRLMMFLLTDPVADGGQWDMFRSLVKKYGVVPKEAMPETACSRNTADLDRYLTRYLRGAARRLRETAESGAGEEDLRDMKKEMMGEVHSMLTTCLGEPPTSFEVRMRDKDDKIALSGTFTPTEFFDTCVGMNLDDYVSVISANTPDKPFGRSFTVSRLGNVVEDGQVRYLNLPLDRLRELAVAQLRDDLPVWFGCDVAQSYLSDEGIMDTAALDVDGLFGFPVEGALNRAERLMYGESAMTHAMVLQGVNLDDKSHTTLWKVENSWGKDHGRDGYDTITDAWFEQYVYQIVIDRAYLTDEERAAYDAKPIELAPWDPMGALACTR